MDGVTNIRGRDALYTAIKFWLLLTLVTGVLYPVLIWGVGKLFYPVSASGGEVSYKGSVVGLHQIGQQWQDPSFFWGRPSDASTVDGFRISGVSKLSPSSKELYEHVMKRKQRLENQDADAEWVLPSDLLFSSASGLDPHIHRESALYQVPRIAKVRGLTAQQQEELVKLVQEFPGESMLESKDSQHVHVLSLNLALLSWVEGDKSEEGKN